MPCLFICCLFVCLFAFPQAEFVPLVALTSWLFNLSEHLFRLEGFFFSVRDWLLKFMNCRGIFCHHTKLEITDLPLFARCMSHWLSGRMQQAVEVAASDFVHGIGVSMQLVPLLSFSP